MLAAGYYTGKNTDTKNLLGREKRCCMELYGKIQKKPMEMIESHSL